MKLSQDQLDSMHADYLRELVNETGFCAPKMWSNAKPRNFREYVRLKCEEMTTCRVESDFNSAFQKITNPTP